MGCCGGGKKRSVRQQAVEKKTPQKQVVVQRIRRSSASTGSQTRQVTVSRQHVVPRQKCQKCGYPTMAVNIAGRERLQCSNPNCRLIVK